MLASSGISRRRGSPSGGSIAFTALMETWYQVGSDGLLLGS